MKKTRSYNITSIFLLIILILFGLRYGLKENVKWGDNVLTWDNFITVDSLTNDFDAEILSGIKVLENYDDDSFEIYAYMDPNESRKVRDSLNKQLLIHEKYHFNITEYHARLLRKEIISAGINNLTQEKVDKLHIKYNLQNRIMQAEYDGESDHNKETEKQRFWELKIDELLRETEIYKNSKLSSYNKYKPENTDYFKNVLHTFENEILTSYPVNNSMKDFGEVYQVLRYKDSIVVRHYQNGVLTNGGSFDTSIFKIIYNKTNDTIENHYLNSNKTYNLSLPYQKSRFIKTEIDELKEQYFDQEKNRVLYKNYHSRVWKYLPNNRIISSFYDKSGNDIVQADGVYQERRTLDSIGRLVLLESLGRDGKYCLDKSDLSSAIRYHYNENHNLKQRIYFDFYGRYAKHINQYNILYKYDDLNNIKEQVILNEKNEKVEDQNGVSIYKFSYDNRDNLIQTKRYNMSGYPVLGTDDFFKSVTDYDKHNRISFEAKYYFLNRLKFNDDDKWGATKYEYLGDSIELRYNFDVYNNHFNDDTGIATVKNYRDKNGFVRKTQYLDKAGNFAKTDDNVVQYVYDYDNKGNTIEETSLDSLGNKIPFSEDVATIRWKYNDNNVKTKTTYYKTDGSLADAEQNATYNFFILNDKNEITEVRYYDKEMKPVEIDGVFKTQYVLNRFGKDSIVKYYNKANKLKDGIATIKYTYNLFSSLIEEFYFDSSNKPTKDSDGITRLRYLLNDQQQNTGYKLFDGNFYNVNGKKGYHHEKITLDNYGYPISYEYFDKRKRPINISEGYHKLVYERDSLGETIREATYDYRGKLTENKSGIAEQKYKRAKTGLIQVISSYDKNGNLTNNKEGVAETYYFPYLNGLYFLNKELDKNGKEIKKQGK